MRKRIQPDGKKSLKTVILFCTIVSLLILVSLIIRSFSIWQNNSVIGGYAYILQIKGEKDTALVGFDPKGKKASILTVTNVSDQNAIPRVLGIPVDGFVTSKNVPTSHNAISSALFLYAFQTRNTKTNLTSFDFVRLAGSLRTMQNGNVQNGTISFSETKSHTDQKIGELFFDTGIIADEKSVEIVNASDIGGIATRLEDAVTKVGVNVLAVRTASTPEDTSYILATDESSYTVNRLSALLEYPVRVTQDTELAEVRIVLGKDANSSKKW